MNRVFRECFRKSHRLLKRGEYLYVQKNGHRVYGHVFIGIVQVRESGNSRLGITTTKKIGNAVVRNRVRRLVREAYRRRIFTLPNKVDVIVVAKRPAGRLDSRTIWEDLAALGHQVTRLTERLA